MLRDVILVEVAEVLARFHQGKLVGGHRNTGVQVKAVILENNVLDYGFG